MIKKETDNVNKQMKADDKKFKINFFNFGIFFDTFLNTLLVDALWALLSLLLVFVIMFV